MVDGLRRSEQELEVRVIERTQALERANEQLRHKEQQLEYMARHDALTGLPNRTLLDDRIARALASAARRGDMCAYGGDEFVIVLEDLDSEYDAADAAEKIVSRMHRPFKVNGGDVRVNISVGVACFPRDGRTGGQLLDRADMAMYAAKAAGRDGWRTARNVAAPRAQPG